MTGAAVADLALAYLAGCLIVALYLHNWRGCSWFTCAAFSPGWPVAVGLVVWISLLGLVCVSLDALKGREQSE